MQSNLFLVLILGVVDGNCAIIFQYIPQFGFRGFTYRPLGSVWFDHVGVQRITVDAHCGGNNSSNIVRYQ